MGREALEESRRWPAGASQQWPRWKSGVVTISISSRYFFTIDGSEEGERRLPSGVAYLEQIKTQKSRSGPYLDRHSRGLHPYGHSDWLAGGRHDDGRGWGS